MSGVYDQIRKEQVPKKKISGKLWVTLLIEFDTEGNAKILRSFSKPAKESSIKYLKKEKPAIVDLHINKRTEEESLF